jgi:ATP-dependent RNA helicase RhlE
MKPVLKKTHNQFRSDRNSKNRPSKSRFHKKLLNSDNFVQKGKSPEDTRYAATRNIDELPVSESIIKNLLKKGYLVPTEIQDKTMEALLEGRDLMGIAHTGTGKTGAFLIPLAHNLLGKNPDYQILVVTPTRELAVQIEQEFKSITLGLRLFSETLIGGTSVGRDIAKLRRPNHIIIGTPGRIGDMVRQRAIDLKSFSTLVLDEFDRLLDMGFSQEILQMVDGMQNRKQTILFSATEDKSQKAILSKLLDSPVEVRLKVGNITGEHIDQEIIRVFEGQNKMDILLKLIRDPEFEKVLIFADTKRWVSKICKDLRRAGILADEIHGDKSQNYRINALQAFRNKKIKVLVATDVASRGLDIVNVSHVINYQQPQCMESYIHRIGRTGRAGKTGKAYTFVS